MTSASYTVTINGKSKKYPSFLAACAVAKKQASKGVRALVKRA